MEDGQQEGAPGWGWVIRDLRLSDLLRALPALGLTVSLHF